MFIPGDGTPSSPRPCVCVYVCVGGVHLVSSGAGLEVCCCYGYPQSTTVFKFLLWYLVFRVEVSSSAQPCNLGLPFLPQRKSSGTSLLSLSEVLLLVIQACRFHPAGEWGSPWWSTVSLGLIVFWSASSNKAFLYFSLPLVAVSFTSSLSVRMFFA